MDGSMQQLLITELWYLYDDGRQVLAAYEELNPQ